jgi:hypothetical protein
MVIHGKRKCIVSDEGMAGGIRSADIRRRDHCSGRGVEGRQDGDVAQVPSPISCSELSVLVRLAVKGARETASGINGGEGGGDIRLRRWEPRGVALQERGLSVNVRDLRRMQVRGMSCGTGVFVRMPGSRERCSSEGRG